MHDSCVEPLICLYFWQLYGVLVTRQLLKKLTPPCHFTRLFYRVLTQLSLKGFPVLKTAGSVAGMNGPSKFSVFFFLFFGTDLLLEILCLIPLF